VISTRAGGTYYVQALHAIDIRSGAEVLGGPAVIADTQYDLGVYSYDSGPFVLGTGAGSENGKVYFNALREAQRPALALANGRLYVGEASHGDNSPYHGWVLGFDASSLALTAAFNTTPNGGLGGIWESGGRLATDNQGFLYFETGNGTCDEELDQNGFPKFGNYGDSFVKLALDPSTDTNNQNINGRDLEVVDYFTPFNEQFLEDVDADLGSGGLTILPDLAGSDTHRHLLLGSGKEGKIGLLDIRRWNVHRAR
jgi:hypothetical protein